MKKFKIDRVEHPELFDEVNADTTRIDMAEQMQQKLRGVGKLVMIKTLEAALAEMTGDESDECIHAKMVTVVVEALEGIDNGLDALIQGELSDMKAGMIKAYGEAMDTQFAVERIQKGPNAPIELFVQVLPDGYKHDGTSHIVRGDEMPTFEEEVTH